jgi:hypothetical protein
MFRLPWDDICDVFTTCNEMPLGYPRVLLDKGKAISYKGLKKSGFISAMYRNTVSLASLNKMMPLKH